MALASSSAVEKSTKGCPVYCLAHECLKSHSPLAHSVSPSFPAGREGSVGTGVLTDPTLLAAASSSPRYASDLEQARPQTSGEEELQLQLALAMSREEAEKVRSETVQGTYGGRKGGCVH